MKVFKFNNQNQSKSVTTVLLIVSFLTILMVITGNILNPFIYLFLCLMSFLFIIIHVKKSSNVIDEVIFDQDSMKLYFRNKRKNPIVILHKDVLIDVSQNKKITLWLKNRSKLIGYINKQSVETLEEWESLKTLLLSGNKMNL